ncbi:MAG: hypothetical protein ACXACD_21910 [Candidatus Thorarchaeota archaeon]|jgi:hypothetical protein
MAQFGWAYVNCDDTNLGADKGVRYVSGSNVTASSTFTYDVDIGKVTLDGNLEVNGAITASFFVVDETEVISGSTIFGNTDDDTHQFTGSVFVGASGSSQSIFSVSTTTSQSATTGFRVGYRSVTGSGLTSSNDNYIIGIGGTGDLEFRIHSASTAGAGALLVIKDEAAPPRGGNIILSASSGDNIDGNAFYEISGSNPAISLYSNGSDWFVF